MSRAGRMFCIPAPSIGISSPPSVPLSLPSSAPFSPLAFLDIPQQGAYIVELNMGPENSCLALFSFLTCAPVGSEYMNGDVISVRYGSMWKGRKGGSFPNALMINLWEMGG